MITAASYSEGNRQASETAVTASATILEQANRALSLEYNALPIKNDRTILNGGV